MHSHHFLFSCCLHFSLEGIVLILVDFVLGRINSVVVIFSQPLSEQPFANTTTIIDVGFCECRGLIIIEMQLKKSDHFCSKCNKKVGSVQPLSDCGVKHMT